MPSVKPVAAIKLRSTIRRKIVSVVLIGIVTTILLVTVANSWREATRYSQDKTAQITATANVFASAAADAVAAGDKNAILKTLRAIGRVPSFSYARVEDLTGKTIVDLGSTVALVEPADRLIVFRSSLDVQVDIVKGGEKIGHLTVLVMTDDLRRNLIDGLLTGLVAAILSGAIGVVIAFRLQRRITEPLSKLTKTMFEVEQTQSFGSKVEYSSDDETGVLVQTFNNMLEQIQARDVRLSQHREKLEVTVEERTKDFKSAKETAEEANAAKSDFLATMSHEIRTPMNGMLVMAELLSSANLSERHRRYADVVVKSGQSLLTIINDILDFSKIESGKMELENIALDPSVVIDDVLNLFWDKASSNGLDLAGYVAPEIPKTIMGDPVRLNQVISNLVNNALKFTEHGHVIVKVDMIGDAGSPLVRFAVTDTGIGIPQDKLSAVFESFSQADQTTTRRFGGTGLGLAICKRLVMAMGGEISVSSTEGVGSEFSFTVAQAATEASPEVASSFGAERLGHAIVATNSSATSTIISDYLSDFGIETITVSPCSLNEAEVKGKDLVLASPKALDQLTINGAPAPGKPYLISVSQLGDLQSDGLIGEERAHDVLMRPVSRNGILGLVARLKNGAPRGLALLERRESKKPPAFPKANVLVADDSPVNREVVIEALKQMEVTADVVEDGVAAVSAAAEKNYHLILMDCSMPEMDGFEATRCIREAEKDMGHRVPIVALTANVAGVKANEWQDAGMDAYLSKPFRIIDLVETFEEFLPEDIRSQKEEILSKADCGANETEACEAPIVDEPIIDENVLCEAMGCEVGDRGEIVMRVLELFEDHGPPALLKVAESASDKGNSEIADTAHALKSMARNIGAIRLGSACEILEREAKGGHIENLPAKLSHLQIELVAVLDWIKACQDKQPDQTDSMLLDA